MVMGQTMIAAIVTGGSLRTLASVTPIARLTSEPAVIVVPANSPFRTPSRNAVHSSGVNHRTAPLGSLPSRTT